MPDVPAWAIALISAVVGTAVGALLTHLLAKARDDDTRLRSTKGHLQALAVGVLTSGELAKWYLEEGYAAPAYRVPLLAFEHSMPALLSTGRLEGADAAALLRFFTTAQSFNLCLDLTQDAAIAAGNPGAHPLNVATLDKQAARARLKAQQMRPGPADAPSEYDGALTAVKNNLPWAEVQRIQAAVEAMDRPRRV